MPALAHSEWAKSSDTGSYALKLHVSRTYPSTAGDDRTVKLAEYKSLPSVRRYVMLEQDRVFATVITRTDTGWDHALAGPDGTLVMPEIGVEIPMAELYDGLTLATAPQVIAPASAPSGTL